MQFLVYLAVLMVSIGTVLLEVHWLTSPAPQPKPTIQASAPPAPKTEGPNAALSPIYPKKPDAPRPAETGNSQAQNTPQVASVPPASQTAPAQQREPAAPPGQTAPAEQTLPAPPSPPSQRPATTPKTQAPPAALKSQAEAALSQAPAPQASAANAPSQQKSPAETTGVAAREENTRQAAADPTRSTNRVDDVQRTAQGSSSNRCDVQACASAYRSFRIRLHLSAVRRPAAVLRNASGPADGARAEETAGAPQVEQGYGRALPRPFDDGTPARRRR